MISNVMPPGSPINDGLETPLRSWCKQPGFFITLHPRTTSLNVIVLIIRILVLGVLDKGPLFSETPI